MNYWETKFKKGAIWEFEPADSAILTADYFHKQGIKKILIPGIGYGRNVRPFLEKGIEVTGIEIAKSAIEIAKKVSLFQFIKLRFWICPLMTKNTMGFIVECEK